MRKLYNNFRNIYPSNVVQAAFYNASNTTHPQAFKSAINEFERISKDVAVNMKELDPVVWPKAYFDTHSKIDSIKNNIGECFNSWIIKVKYMPLIDMPTEIHDMLMARMHKKRDKMSKRNCVIMPIIKEILNFFIKESASYTLLLDGRDNYNVEGEGSSVYVNLPHRTCSFRIQDFSRGPLWSCIYCNTTI